MLYIFDLDNVILEIDFNRALGVWSNLSCVPLASLKNHFCREEHFARYERGHISNEHFATLLCQQLDIALGYEQFVAGWQAVFIDVRPEVITLIHQLQQQGNRTVILANTNALHYNYWLSHYPQIAQTTNTLYLSQEMGLRKPETAIYQQVLQQEKVETHQAVYFDDELINIEAAQALGITSIHVTDAKVISSYLA